MVKTVTAGLAALSIVTLAAFASAAEPSTRPLTVQDEVVRKECGACHMVFTPSKLTKGGWHKIMTTLPDHFGEDASLPADKVQHIDAYLAANAMDAEAGVRTKMRLDAWKKKGLIDPIRITETPEWIRHHPQKSSYNEMAKAIGYDRGSNCIMCHKNAEHGVYEDNFER